MNNNNKSLIVIAVGGSGGHLYPAQALAKDLRSKDLGSGEHKILFLGHGLATSRFFDREAFEYVDIQSGAISLKKFWRLPQACFFILKGLWRTQKIFRKSPPKLVVGFGSYHSFPVLLAAWMLRVPYILFEANALLGKVNQLFSKKAEVVAHQLFDLQGRVRSKKLIKTCLPQILTQWERVRKEQARQYFGVDLHTKTILIVGGSQGAVSLNHLVIEALLLLKKRKMVFQVMHWIGFGMDVTEVSKVYAEAGIAAVVKPHEKQMHHAYSSADLLISRAGANTVAEQIYHSLPALFIPYPYLSDDHQTWNARYSAETLQGASVLAQKSLTSNQLAAHIEALLEEERYGKMQQALQRAQELYDKKHPTLSEIVLEYVTKR